MSAEILWHQPTSTRFATLQWGRAQMSAEISEADPHQASADALQWGRAQMSAEIKSGLRFRFSLPGFNGAALR